MWKNVYDFFTAALPWLCMGLLIAVFLAKSTWKKKGKEETCGAEGMSLGMCFGVALGTSLGNVGIGMMAGMLAGFLIGLRIKKEDSGN